uniref:Uncharacterized protein n=1 Tax=Lactuca sativa TaxID=4236 RepID=A0A9R1XLH8_LACSA|nr:hypothetical protein LSAT_V11C300108970 [Lactuca sativa]
MLEVSTSAQELTLGGDISYELFLRDSKCSKGILEALRKRAHIMTDGFNSCKSVVCNFTKDAMYSFPNYPKKQLKLQKVLEKFLMFSIASSSWKPLAFPLSLVQALAKKKGSLLFSFAIYTLLVYLFIYLINLVLKSW